MKKTIMTICLMLVFVGGMFVSECAGKCKLGESLINDSNVLTEIQKLPKELREKIAGSIEAVNTFDIVKYYSYYNLPIEFQIAKGKIKIEERPEYFSADPNVKYKIEESVEILKDVNSIGAFRTILIVTTTADLFAIDKPQRNFQIVSIKFSQDKKRVVVESLEKNKNNWKSGTDEWSYYDRNWWKVL